MKEIRVTKIQAAQRQINAGIQMLFRNEDPVAIHTVAMAGFRILRDLMKKSDLAQPIDSMISLEKRKNFGVRYITFPISASTPTAIPPIYRAIFRKTPTIPCCLLPPRTTNALVFKEPKRCRFFGLGTCHFIQTFFPRMEA